MKTAVIFILALATSVQAWTWGDHTPGCRVRFDAVNFNDAFFAVPLNETMAISQNWTKATQLDDVPELYKELVMYCYECDGPISILYEQYTGKIAGLQVGLNIEDYVSSAYDLEENGWKLWTWTCGGVTRTLYTLRMYFLTEKFLSKNAADRIASYDTTKIAQDGYVVTDGPGGKQLQNPTKVSEMISQGEYTKQNCIPFMGTHYYHNMSATLECSAKTIYPWFLTVDGDDVTGVSMMTFLKVKKQSGSRDWMEHPPQLAVKLIVPRAPECFYKMAESPGACTMHINLIDFPQGQGCWF